MTNTTRYIAIAFHQTVVGIALLFLLIVAQAEFEIHTAKLDTATQKNNTPCVLQTNAKALYLQ
jgi:hypothetical protein